MCTVPDRTRCFPIHSPYDSVRPGVQTNETHKNRHCRWPPAAEVERDSNGCAPPTPREETQRAPPLLPPAPQSPQPPTLHRRGLSDSLCNHPPRPPDRGRTSQCLETWQESRSPKDRGCTSKGLERVIGVGDEGNCEWGRGAAALPPRQLL